MGHLVTLRIPQHPDYTKYGMEVKNGTGTSLSNIHVDKVYLTQNMWESTRQVKTAIKEIKVDALETLMQLQPKQYYRKSEMQKLYEKREKIVAGEYQEPMPTIKDVPLEYGFIAEEMPECLATEDRKNCFYVSFNDYRYCRHSGSLQETFGFRGNCERTSQSVSNTRGQNCTSRRIATSTIN